MAALLSAQAPDDEAALWSMRQGAQSDAARQALFARYSSFAFSIARRRFRDRSRGDLELADLEQMACAGLLEAIDRYDVRRGISFRSYAAHRISGSIADGIARSTEVREQLSAGARRRRERLRSLSPEQIAQQSPGEALDALTELAMGLALGFMLEGTSLYREEGEERTTPSPTAYDSQEWQELSQRLAAELKSLPHREQTILREHYLSGLPFETLADLLGVSKGRISQLHRAALIALRKKLARSGHFSLER
jgi:RNA polymerase sigma factor FliA